MIGHHHSFETMPGHHIGQSGAHGRCSLAEGNDQETAPSREVEVDRPAPQPTVTNGECP